MNATTILAGGLALVRNQPRAVAIWGILYLVLILVAMAALWPLLDDLFAFQQAAIAAQGAALPPPPPPPGFFLAILGINAVLLVALVVIFAAAVRAVASGGQDSFGFLRLGMDELRLVGLGVLLFLIEFAALIGFVLVAVILIFVLVALFGDGAGAAVGAVTGVFLYLAMLVVMVWAQVRISLAGALTVLRGRIVIREAWHATRGRFWTLFAVYLVIALGFFAVGIVALLLTNPDLVTAYIGGMRPQAMEAAIAQQQAIIGDLFGPRMLVMSILGTVFNAVALAIGFGAVATAALDFDRADHGISEGND